MVDNYAITGITKLIYGIRTDAFMTLENDSPIFSQNVYEIGVEYKQSDQSSWIKCIVAQSENLQTPLRWDTVTYTSDNGPYTVPGVFQAQDKGDYGVVAYSSGIEYHPPILVLIKNLQPDTLYDVRAYYVGDSGTIHNFNQTTIATNPNLNRPLTLGTITIGDDVYQYKNLDKNSEEGVQFTNQLTSSINSRFDQTFEVVNSMVNRDVVYNNNPIINVEINNGNFYGASYSNNTIKSWRFTPTLTTIIHELSHGFLPKMYDDIIYDTQSVPAANTAQGQYRNRMKKYLSFCTGNYNNPECIWRNDHNFPIISDNPSGVAVANYQQYDVDYLLYVYAHLTVAAWEIARPQIQ